jgi:hypothetical protein
MNAPAVNGVATLNAECAGDGEFSAPSAYNHLRPGWAVSYSGTPLRH